MVSAALGSEEEADQRRLKHSVEGGPARDAMRSCVLGCHGQRVHYSFGARRFGDDSSALLVLDKGGVHGEIHHPKSESGKEGAGDGRSGDPEPDVDDGDVCFGAELQASDMFPAMPVISNPASIATSSITRAIPGSSSTMSRRMVRLQGGYKIGAALSGVANRKHRPPQAVPRVGLESQVPSTKVRDPDASLRSRVRALCAIRTNEVSEDQTLISGPNASSFSPTCG